LLLVRNSGFILRNYSTVDDTFDLTTVFFVSAHSLLSLLLALWFRLCFLLLVVLLFLHILLLVVT
jgi:hypothetical protein